MNSTVEFNATPLIFPPSASMVVARSHVEEFLAPSRAGEFLARSHAEEFLYSVSRPQCLGELRRVKLKPRALRRPRKRKHALVVLARSRRGR